MDAKQFDCLLSEIAKSGNKTFTRILCDSVSGTKFIRCFYIDGKGPAIFRDLKADGTEYIRSGFGVYCDFANQAIVLPDVCVEVDSVAQYVTPLQIYNPNTGSFEGTVYFDRMGTEITGVVTSTDPCNCPCLDCSTNIAEACILRFTGFDYQDHSFWTPGDTLDFEVFINGGSIGIVSEDIGALPATNNKSTWYADLVALINTTAFNISVITDAGPTSGQKVQFEIGYTGPVAITLDIVRLTGTNDILTITIDNAGLMNFSFLNGGSSEESGTFTDCSGAALQGHDGTGFVDSVQFPLS